MMARMQGSPIALDYQRPMPRPGKFSGHVVAAILLGLFTCVPILSGLTVFALVRAGRPHIEAGRRRGRWLAHLAMVIGVLNLIVTSILALWCVWYLLVGRERFKAVRSMANLRTVSLVIMMYTSENRGYFPHTLDPLASTYRVPLETFRSPKADPSKPAITLAFGPCDYVYAPPADRITRVRQPAQVPVLYEAPANYRGVRTIVAFADGHVETVTGPRMGALIAEVEANRAAATQPVRAPTKRASE